MNDPLAAYIQDLVYMFREAAAEARQDCERLAQGADRAFQEGRHLAYLEVLSKMQHQADVFSIPREALGLAGFDPVHGPVAATPVRGRAPR